MIDTTYPDAPVHVIDQAGQPYGSERRCCNRCGAMAVAGMWIVQHLEDWRKLPRERRCDGYVEAGAEVRP